MVVLDYLMPEMNGAEEGKMLRAHPVTKDVKILMYSGTSESEATIQASFTYYDACLTKPADGRELLHAVGAL